MSNFYNELISKFNLSSDKIEFFRSLPTSQKAFLLENSSKNTSKDILNSLTKIEILEIFEFLDPDDVTDLLQLLPKSKQKSLLLKLNKNLKKKVDFLLKFAPNSAAGIMNLNYILITVNDTKSKIIEKIENHLKIRNKEPTILVVDTFGKFLGELKISDLLFKNSKNLFQNLHNLPTVTYNEDQEECIDIFKKNLHEKVVVLDENQDILGIIKAKDIFKVVEEEYTEDFYNFAGLDTEEEITDTFYKKVKFRIGWLIINLFTAFLAAFVVSQFENTISKLVLLAAFMPIVAGMGGNAGTQTTAILIRGLALKKIDLKLGRKILLQEFLAAIINGLIIGFIVSLIAYIFNQSLLFGLVAAIAILVNLIIASIFGTIIPLLLKALNFDPASSSSVFVTTTTDIFGFLTFLGLATLILI